MGGRVPARRRQADQGRRRLRPRAAAGRLRGDARRAHRDHAQAAARARGQGDRRRLLPRPRGVGALGQPHHREPHPARHARVPRPGDDARRRRERRPRAARRRGRDADLRAGRRTRPVVERDTARMAEICREEGAISVEVAADEDAAGKLLAARRGAIPALARLAPTLILEDATVPRSELAGMVRDVQRDRRGGGPPDRGLRARRRRQPAPDLLHRRARPRPGRARAPRVRPHLRRRRSRAAGTITGEHGIGVTKLQYLEQRLGPVGIDLLRGIKRAFDPLGLLNPGKAVP